MLLLLLLLVVTRVYHPMEIARLAAENPAHWSGDMATHVVVRGFVTYAELEKDGDRHLRVCDSSKVVGMDRAHCVVGEILPGSKVAAPRVGSCIEMSGVTRFDGEGWNPVTKTGSHGWWEIHPVEKITAVSCGQVP